MIDGARLFTVERAAAPTRFVVLRDGDARVALQVDAVLEVGALAGRAVGRVPALAGALADARWVAPA